MSSGSSVVQGFSRIRLYPSPQLCYNPHRFTIPSESKRALRAAATIPLVEAFEHQDESFSSAFAILRQAIAERAFPAASVAVTHQGRLIALKSFGRIPTEAGAPPGSRPGREGGDFDSPVTPATRFDLASLTKPVATTTMAGILYERGLLELAAPVIGIIPEFLVDACGEVDPRRRDVTFRMLLAHSSGLPAYEKLFLRAHSRDDLLRAAFLTPLSADPGTRAEYSDMGFIILGAALERIAEESIAAFCQREVFGPLAMTQTTFNPPADTHRQIPPTADERTVQPWGAGTAAAEMPAGTAPPDASPSTARSTFRKKIIQGEVQDENASILGGMAGHAGLFSSAGDLARFAHAILYGGRPILRPETVVLLTRREPAPSGTSRALGWDTPSAPSQAGSHFGPRSFGHLGYTGTSLWIDPDRRLSITLLTNRTWPDGANQAIKRVRPQFHDSVIEALQRN
jgi:CubicO group peptidase (beta-lactamase class C family)